MMPSHSAEVCKASATLRRAALEKSEMNIPIKFPSDEDVIIEEVTRFRRLSPEDRMRSIRGLLQAGAFMLRRSPKVNFLREYTLDQEARARQSIQEFLERHGC
jgi:hypothetical protein